MSTTPYERIEYWKKKEGHTHSKILAQRLTHSEAQRREKIEAEKRGCRYHGGGPYIPGNVWYVYLVW